MQLIITSILIKNYLGYKVKAANSEHSGLDKTNDIKPVNYCKLFVQNQFLVLLVKATSVSITGTSTNTPTTVARAAPD